MRNFLSVPMADPPMKSKPNIGPLVLMSGSMTKRTRTMNRRWKQRWWQLLDNGLLLYFQNDKRVKLLGEIDIGRTCYDVRLGAKSCGIVFPRVAPSCCCISFTVLKRTYYTYAPTAAEAKKWAEAIHKVSNVLNRRVVAGVERRKAPVAPGPSRPPSCPPNFRISMTPWDLTPHYNISLAGSVEDVYRVRVKDDSDDLPRPRRRRMIKKMASSVPDNLDHVGIALPPDPGARLWLDGSPLPDPCSLDFSTPTITKRSPSPIIVAARESVGSMSTSSPKDSILSSLSIELGSSSCTSNASLVHTRDAVSPLWRDSKKRHSLPDNFEQEFDRLEKKEEWIKHRLQSRGIPPRPASIATYPKSCYTSQPHPQPRPRHLHISPGAVQVIPRSAAGKGIPGAIRVMPVENGELKKLRHKTYSKSTDCLASQTEEDNRSRSHSIGSRVAPDQKRPVPKPRRSKGASTSPQNPKRVSFSDTSYIMNPDSPTGPESTGLVFAYTISGGPTVDTSDLPPPRPRKDSGPPNFKPPPPPIEERGESFDSTSA